MAKKQFFAKAFIIHGCVENELVYLKLFLQIYKNQRSFLLPTLPSDYTQFSTARIKDYIYTVDNLTKEVTSLKATIAIIGKSNQELHSPSPVKQQGTQQHPQ